MDAGAALTVRPTMVGALSTPETIELVAVLVAVLAFVGRELHASAIERKRAQPVVGAHEHGPRRLVVDVGRVT